ncbi:hypothetical protein [Streptomyces sp. Da 82-17]|uniref:hypothetical protein n=1 Tax=Streptomyces sp. Da 82-17 TaxID=3377116 RepID=UPI0038D50375
MIQAKRILAAVALAAGASALAAPTASAAISVSGELDNLAKSGISPEFRDDVPSVSRQLDQVNQLGEVQQKLAPLTDQAAPVVGLLGAVG